MNFQAIETILGALGSNFLNLSKHCFVYGPQGRLLQRNIESLWFDHCVTMPPYNVFLTTSDKLLETLDSLRDASMDFKPLGLASLENSKTIWNKNFYPPDCKAITHRIGKVAVITDKDNAKNMFHRKQRERKVWWRKFARHPSRFALTEVKKISKNREIIDIAAQFEFGNVVLETISYQQGAKKNCPQIDDQKEEALDIHMVEHTASLDWGCLAMLCDGFEVTDDKGELKIHPKLSPYKVGFYMDLDENEEDLKSQEKSRLILYLNNLLKAKGLETVLTRSKREIETFHVPLTVIVDDASLQNGIVRVTSQLTMIAEAVHITQLPKYVAARCT